ncbi:MAG: hypothetical protein NTX90_02890 [Alphaproteobacteria bacterium]|nr:hypothetical protein [Alphaproteobacteria bacterium]
MSFFLKGLIFCLTLGLSAASANETTSKLREINLTASAATAVIAGLQDKINAGSVRPADLDASALKTAYRAAYGRLANKEIAAVQEAELKQIHDAMDRSMEQVMAQFRADILKGGQDAFVPAFFRAQLFLRFNEIMGGQYRAVVTNRRQELINGDSAPERVIENAEILKQINEWLERGHTQPETRSVGNSSFGFWPMAITEPCMTCHQRNGLQQRIGQFGGATVIMSNR